MSGVLHVIAPFHNVPADRFSTCAFASQAKRFPSMMRPLGYTVIEYANEGSESDANEHVRILSTPEREALFPSGLPMVGGVGWQAYSAKLRVALEKRVAPDDFVLHFFGAPHADLVPVIKAHHVEPIVGYLDKPFGADRVYQSEAWRNFHFALAELSNVAHDKARTWTVPPAFDLDEWPAGHGEGDDGGPFVLFMGRLIEEKGLTVVAEIVRTTKHRVYVVGTWTTYMHQWMEALTPNERARVCVQPAVLGRARAEIMGAASCILMPTCNMEAFGMVGVEAMLTGTPLIASAWGPFVETVEPDLTGYLCRTPADWIRAIDAAAQLDRKIVARRTQARFSLNVIGGRFDAVFRHIAAA